MKTEQIEKWKKFLRDNTACKNGYTEAHTKTPQEWWESTKRSDWMMWVLLRIGFEIPKEISVKYAIFCAESIPQSPAGSSAIQAAKNWVNCPTPEMESAARSAARSAAWSAARSAAESAAWSAQADYLRTVMPILKIKGVTE